jgi:predicted dehydrogenase
MGSEIRILLVGTGRMAETHARRFAQIDNVRVIAAIDTNLERATNFCRSHHIDHVYQDLHTALSAQEYDAVSVVTPDSHHAPVALTALEFGLPVLCEKPLSDTIQAASSMCSAAEKTGLLNMVNLSYRESGALYKARALVHSRALGDIRHVEASYRQSWLSSDYWGDWREEDAWLWRLSKSHGSLGVLGDIGIHILDFLCNGADLDITGLHCRLQTFDKAPNNRIGDYTLDANDSCVLNVELENGALGVVHMSRYYTGFMNSLEMSIHGTDGAIRVSTGQGSDRLWTCIGKDRHTHEFTTQKCEPQPDTFERFINALRSGSKSSPDFAHTMKLQRYLEACFNSHETGQWLTLSKCTG